MADTVAACRAELSKVLGIRSTLAALVIFAAFSVLVGALEGSSSRSAIARHSPLLRSDFTPQQAGLDGILYGQLALIVFGVLVVAGEYSSGMMRTSLLAVPRRGRLYAAKMTVTGAVSVFVAIPVTLISYLVTQLALGPYGVSISSGGAFRALAGGVIYLALMSLFAAGVTAITRNAVVPLAALLPMVLAGSHLLTLLGATRRLASYLPDQAGTHIVAVHGGDTLEGLMVMLTWTVVALAVGFVRHSRWDG